MNPDSIKQFNVLLKSLDYIQAKISRADGAGKKGKAGEELEALYEELKELKITKNGWEKDDLAFFCILQNC